MYVNIKCEVVGKIHFIVCKSKYEKVLGLGVNVVHLPKASHDCAISKGAF